MTTIIPLTLAGEDPPKPIIPRLKKKIKVGLVQINNSFSGQNYLPLSVGMLQAYAQKTLAYSDFYEFLLPIYLRDRPTEEMTEMLSEADVVAFSMYTWNGLKSLAVAKELKKIRPNIVTVFGGPHVPDKIEFVPDDNDPQNIIYDNTRTEKFLRQYPFVDIACHGEGEKIFKAILENLHGDWVNIPSVSYVDQSDNFVQTPRIGRTANLDEFPSPYLEGTFEQLMQANPNERWIVMWETNRGCPYSCRWCDWGSATASKVNRWKIDRIFQEIEWFAGHKIEYIFCADANFGILTRDIEIARYLAEIKMKKMYPQTISVQSTKNAQDRSFECQRILAEAKMNKVVVISVQSMNPETLEAVARQNISMEAFKGNMARYANEKIDTITDFIIGQPLETYESTVAGVDELINLGQHKRIQFNTCSVLPNTPFAHPLYLKKYGIETVVGPTVNVHGFLPDKNEILEEQELVIATSSMSRESWAKMRAFTWAVSLLYFDKIFQIPIITLRHCTKLGYGEILEYFSDGKFNRLGRLKDFPVLNEISRFFTDKARDIQNCGYEYCHSPQWLNIFWTADEYIFIKLCLEGKLEEFYEEARRALCLLLASREVDLEPQILNDAIRLNMDLVKSPGQRSDTEIKLSYNIPELYRSVILNRPKRLESKPCVIRINRTSETWASQEAWLEKVVWWGYRKGAYLYDTAIESDS